MHGKAIWKHGIGKIAKASRDIAPGPHKGGGEGTAPQFQRPNLGYGFYLTCQIQKNLVFSKIIFLNLLNPNQIVFF